MPTKADLEELIELQKQTIGILKDQVSRMQEAVSDAKEAGVVAAKEREEDWTKRHEGHRGEIDWLGRIINDLLGDADKPLRAKETRGATKFSYYNLARLIYPHRYGIGGDPYSEKQREELIDMLMAKTNFEENDEQRDSTIASATWTGNPQ